MRLDGFGECSVIEGHAIGVFVPIRFRGRLIENANLGLETLLVEFNLRLGLTVLLVFVRFLLAPSELLFVELESLGLLVEFGLVVDLLLEPLGLLRRELALFYQPGDVENDPDGRHLLCLTQHRPCGPLRQRQIPNRARQPSAGRAY